MTGEGGTGTPRPRAMGAQARSVARLAAVQALYQHDMEGTPGAQLIHEFHRHRLDSDASSPLAPAEQAFFDDLVSGAACFWHVFPTAGRVR